MQAQVKAMHRSARTPLANHSSGPASRSAGPAAQEDTQYRRGARQNFLCDAQSDLNFNSLATAVGPVGVNPGSHTSGGFTLLQAPAVCASLAELWHQTAFQQWRGRGFVAHPPLRCNPLQKPRIKRKTGARSTFRTRRDRASLSRRCWRVVLQSPTETLPLTSVGAAQPSPVSLEDLSQARLSTLELPPC